jgi:ligand-binding sensor domain-containing protein
MRVPGLRWAAVLALAACRAGAGPSGPVTPTAADFVIVARAETGPITALAARAPYLWAAGAPGLRRWDVTSGEYEVVGGGEVKGTRALTALAVDDEGSAWVASAEETGRWVTGGGPKDAPGLRYETAGSPGDVVALAPRQPVKTKGVWAGGPGGLYRHDGRRWRVVDGLSGTAVGWLALDDDGVTAWVGTRDKGLYRADDRGAAPAPGGATVLCDQIVGMAHTSAGTRVVAGNVNGDARVYALTLAGTVELRAPIGVHAAALVQRGNEAVLLAGPVGRERAYALRALDPGEPVPAGGLRFTEVASEIAHWTGAPVDVVLPEGVTAAAALGDALYIGSRALGVARAEALRPHAFDGSELVGDAERFTVACRAGDQCLVVTDGPRAWKTDGDRYQAAGVGESERAAVLAVAADREGNTVAVSAEPDGKTLTVTRRAAAGDEWRPIAHAAVELPAKAAPKATFAAVSPGGTLWLGLRGSRGGGEEVGDGALEIDLSTGVAVQHRPRRADETVPADALPLPADLNAVLFDGGAVWFASLAGVVRFTEGQLSTWGEAEGLPSELCWGLARGADGAIWAATSEGLARFDGKSWHPGQGSSEASKVAVHGFAADDAGWLWAATAKGLRVVGQSGNLDQGSLLIPDEMRDLARDGLGRMWALTASSIALIAPAPPPSAKKTIAKTTSRN